MVWTKRSAAFLLVAALGCGGRTLGADAGPGAGGTGTDAAAGSGGLGGRGGNGGMGGAGGAGGQSGVGGASGGRGGTGARGGQAGTGEGGRGGSGTSCVTEGMTCSTTGRACCPPLVCAGSCLMPPSQEGGVRDSAADAACVGSAGFICLVGSCSNDVGLPAVCTNGTWSCPSGSINYLACSGCTGNPPPSYVCTDGGWFRVPDAGGGG